MRSLFSLVQKSLDQSLDLRVFEEASVVAPSVARADCAMLHRELFGVVVSGLPETEAKALGDELAKHGFATEVVEDGEIPPLPDAFRVQRLLIEPQRLVLTDAMGREQVRETGDLVFAAGGFLLDQRMLREGVTVREPADWNGETRVTTHYEHHFKTFPKFQVDLFFWSQRRRLQLVLEEQTAVFHQGRALRLKDEEALNAMLADLRRLLPPERLNKGIELAGAAGVYPSRRAYEEEIRWHFYRLIP